MMIMMRMMMMRMRMMMTMIIIVIIEKGEMNARVTQRLRKNEKGKKYGGKKAKTEIARERLRLLVQFLFIFLLMYIRA